MIEALLFQGLVGLSEAMYLWMVAAGLSLIFGVLRVLNFAHGSFYMLGAYLTLTALRAFGGNFWLALAALPGICVIAWGMERFFLRHVYHLEVAYQLLLTFAFVLIFDDLTRLVWGPVYQAPPTPRGLDRAVSVLGRPFPLYNLFILGVGVALGVGLWLLLERTRWGRLIRAAAMDREMASALGIRVPRLYTAVFVLGALLAGLGGALSLPIHAVSPGMGELIIIEAFIVVVVGGLGSLTGAFLSALLIGLLHAYGIVFLPVFEMALAFILMAVVLILRPWGLFGVREG
ncbi:MAG: branched-chain amino acid ABC transporter permease [Deltaproteobacteria bacterium]|nr:branched-chain amino acid ABC transporter permease [Candidatus Tectomicrobia bacterium]MBI2372096.1 branched-chain amino acid ABC transporter permease [Deltaproteobacteria bacterium]